jgi:PAS domain S-box-containing protein
LTADGRAIICVVSYLPAHRYSRRVQSAFEFNQQLLKKIRIGAWRALNISAVLCALAMLRWFFDRSPDGEPFAGLGRLRIDTAGSILVLICVRLYLLELPKTISRSIAVVLGVSLVGLVSLFNLANFFMGFWDVPASWSHSPAVSLSLLMFAVAELSQLAPSPRLEKLRQFILTSGLCVGFSASVGFFFGADSVRSLKFFDQIAFFGAVQLLWYSVATLLLNPVAGWLPILTAESMGSKILRRMLPICAITIFVVVYVVVHGELAGLYDRQIAMDLLIVGLSLVFIGALFFIALNLNSSDRERSLAFAELLQTEAELKTAQSVAKVGSFVRYQDRERSKWSDEMYVIFGLDPSEIASVPGKEKFIFPEDLELFQTQLSECERTGRPVQFEHRILRADGGERVVRTHAKAVFNPTTGQSEIHGTIHDITEHRALFNQLRVAEQMYTDLYNEAPDMLLSVDAVTGLVIRCNNTLLNKLGYESSEVVGSHILSLYHPDVVPVVREIWAEYKGTGVLSNRELKVLTKSGRTLDVSLSSTAVMDEEGNQLYSRSIWRDISDSKKAQEFSIRERAAAESSRMKSSFIATMSHEIRTPLNGVIGMSEILLGTDLDPRQRDFADTIKRSADTLLVLVNDILDFSKIESGKVELELFDFEVRTLLTDLERQMNWSASRKGIRLDFIAKGCDDLIFKADVNRLSQILLNLVSNAIKFTDEGVVHVIVTAEQSRDGFATLKFEVIDTGIGIPSDERHRLFQPFSQSDSSIARRYGGTGLGLSISQNLAKLMNGEIRVESQLGRGSRFYFSVTVPCRANLRSNSGPSSERHLALDFVPHVLVAEDSDVNQKVVRLVLEKIGCQVTVADNGAEAIRLLQLNGPFDLILMDCQMPVLNGFEATQEIRTLEDPRLRDSTIIALTAFASTSDREACFEAGMNDYLTKPVSAKELSRVIGKWIRSASNDDMPRDLINHSTLAELHALGTEDQDVVRDVLKLFEAKLPQRLEALKAAISIRNSEEIVRCAHGLKSSSSSLGAVELGRRCEEVIAMAKGQDFAATELALQDLTDLCFATADRIRNWRPASETSTTFST